MFRRKSRWRGPGPWIGMALLAFSLVAISQRAEGQILVFNAPAEPLTAGTPAAITLNVLNPSAQPLSWTFPRRIQYSLALPGAAPVSEWMERDAAAPVEPVTIPAGSFARAQYWFTPPATAGQLILEFPDLKAERLVLDVQTPTAPAEVAPRSGLARMLKQAEPREEGREFDPGRFFKEHISGYEPFYFLAGTESPNAKFQISFKYQILNSEGALARKAPWLKGSHFAYTQTSLWDWNSPSAPFFDSSYKPEALYLYEGVVGGRPDDWFQLDLQAGFQHESNGQDGADSRSLNILYLRPRLTFGREDHLQFTLEPRAWVYIGDLSDNPDIDEYRGYADLRAILGWKRGLKLSALGRLGDTGDHGSVQLDLTYPMMTLLSGSFSVYLHAQYFNGYGESLLFYNERSSAFRVGFSLYR